MCDHHHHHHHHDDQISLSFYFTYASFGWKIPEGKLLIIYSSLIGISSIIELGFGIYTGDSHVVSEGFHTLFHGMCIWTAMIALAYTINHSEPDDHCSFGYSRAQIVAAFGNSIFLFFIAFFALFEAVHEIISETISDSNSDILPLIATKILLHSLFFFYLRTNLFESEKNSNDNLGVVALHSLGLLITDIIRGFSLFFELECMAYPIYQTESILNIIWVAALLYLVKPYFYRNGKILLLCTPTGKNKENLVKKIREVSLIEGVVGVKEEKMWLMNNQEMVGSLKIEVHGDGKNVVPKAKEILKGILSHVAIEIEDSDVASNYT